MPQQPSRRDVTGPISVLRHHQTSLRRRDPGFLDGRFATPQPVPDALSLLVNGDDGGADDNSVIGEDGDRLTLTGVGTQTWTLSYTPIAETIVVRWHPDAGAGVEWKRDEHYTIDDDDRVITITAEALSANKAQVGDVFSAQYLRLDGEQDAPADARLTSLLLVGASGPVNSPSSIALPAGTQVGDLIVVGNATMHSTGAPGTATVTDARMTQVGHGAWYGIATHLGPVTFFTPGGTYRHTACVAVFRAPAYYKNDLDATGGGGIGATMTAPQPDATAAVMVFTSENPNGLSYEVNSYPAGYVPASTPWDGSTVCSAGVYYWPPDGTSTPPAGTVVYHAHSTGVGYLTVIGLEGEEL